MGDGSSPPSIAWTEGGPPTVAARVPIFTAPAQGELRVLCLSDTLVQVFTHFDTQAGGGRGRTSPCYGLDCLYCHGPRRLSRRWKGFLGCWHPTAGRTCLLEVTREAWCHAYEWLEYADASLRGRWLRAYRISKTPQAQARIELAIPGTAPNPLPEAPDVRGILERIWGVGMSSR